MKILSNQKGSSHLVLILAVVVIAVVAFAGFRVLHNDPLDSSSTSTASQAGVPATLKSASDVRKADKALDNTAIDGQVNPNRLDSDLDALL